jgi:hypothetical protein
MRKAQYTNVYSDAHQEEPKQSLILHWLMHEDISVSIHSPGKKITCNFM